MRILNSVLIFLVTQAAIKEKQAKKEAKKAK